MASSTSTYLGIDLGTTALKCIITDHKQRVVGLAEVSLPIITAAAGLVGTEAAGLVAGAAEGLQDAALQEPQGLGAHRGHRAFRADAWGGRSRCGRARFSARPFCGMTGAPGRKRQLFNGKFSDVGQIAGVAAVAGFTAPKLLWLQAHEPKIFKQLAMVLAPKDYLRFRMSGDFITDPCDASGMSLLDVGQRKWSPALVEAAGIRLENLPRIEEGPQASAHLHKAAAEFLGLPPGLPIAAGAGDAAASAIGIGAINDGDGFISLGTSAQYFVTTKSFRPRPQQMIQALGHGLPDLWYQVAALLNGASPLSWLNGVLQGGTIQSLLQRTQRRYRRAGAHSVLALSQRRAHTA